MIDFRSLYRFAEEHTAAYIAVLFGFFFLLIAAQSIFSGLAVLAITIGAGFFILTLIRPFWTLVFLSVYLPFESFFLTFIPDEIYVFARYLSEGLIYLLLVVVLWKRFNRGWKFFSTPIDVPFFLFLIVAITSILVNAVEPSIAILGLRQIVRFILLFFIAVFLSPSRTQIRRLTFLLLGITGGEAALGLLQAVIGQPLDQLLLPSETHTLGDIVLTSGVVQSWDFGSRIFATLGRYDRLGTFLAFFLLIAVGFLYEWYLQKKRFFLIWLFVLGLPALLLTYSRSAWFGFLSGFLFIGLWIKRDRRVLLACLIFLGIIISYLLYSGLVVRYLVDVPEQTVIERFFEAFSYERWRGEYYGLGRLFWIVQTILFVVPSSPFFGFGPGQYGGGAVAALGNGRVYEHLGLPFGVYGTDGYIDNNWFSLWGETGTLGLIFYLWMYLGLFFYTRKVYREAKNDRFVRALALGYMAAMIAVALNAFLATFLEVRTLAFYLWLYGGFIVVLGQKKKIFL
jgi:hypothetical protein